MQNIRGFLVCFHEILLSIFAENNLRKSHVYIIRAIERRRMDLASPFDCQSIAKRFSKKLLYVFKKLSTFLVPCAMRIG